MDKDFASARPMSPRLSRKSVTELQADLDISLLSSVHVSRGIGILEDMGFAGRTALGKPAWSDCKSLTDLRNARESELTGAIQGAPSGAGSSESCDAGMGYQVRNVMRCRVGRWEPASLMMAQVCGAFPPGPSCQLEGPHRAGYCAVCYQLAALLLALLSWGSCLGVTVASQTGGPRAGFGGDDLLLSDFALTSGSLAVLLLVTRQGFGRGMRECVALLRDYATLSGCDAAAVNSGWDVLLSLTLLAASVAERLRGSGALRADGGLRVWEAFHVVAFSFSALVLLSTTNLVLYVARMLAEIVDAYCRGLANATDLGTAIHEWNVLQAVLRKASKATGHCFFVLQTTILAAVLLGAFDSQQRGDGHMLALIPGALVLVGSLRIYCAAAVTSKCSHVPPLVNSLSFNRKSSCEIDHDRQYLIQYISNSVAGFYVYDVRLTPVLALKIGYVCAAIVFTLVTRSITQP